MSNSRCESDGANSPATSFCVSKWDTSRRVLDELRESCASMLPENFQWPNVICVTIDHAVVRFHNVFNEFMLSITNEDAGFEATRAYMILLCKGCPARGAVVAAAPDEIEG